MTTSEVPESAKATDGQSRPGSGIAGTERTGADSNLESASLLAELRMQREANVALVLEVSGRRTVADLAARREEVLLGQLDLERRLRRRAEEDLRESQALGSRLAHELALSDASAASARQEVQDAGAQVSAMQARTTALLVKLSEVEARRNALEADIINATAIADDALDNQQRLTSALAQSETGAEQAISALLVAEALNRRLAAGIRKVAGHLTESLGALTAADGASVSSEGEGEVSQVEMTAILDGMAQLQAERQSAASALVDAGRATLELAAALAGLQRANQELLVEIEAERNVSTAQAVQIERLSLVVAEQEGLAGRLDALLSQRDDTIAELRADHAAASARLQQLDADAKRLAAQLAQANEGIRAGREDFSRRQEELQAERDRAREDARASASKAAEAERANSALVQTRQKLEQEAEETGRLLEERRHAIRKLQQEVALLKLGRA